MRYEDMVEDPIAHFDAIHDFIYDPPMPDGLRSDIDKILASSGDGGALQSGNATTRVYEKGYSGKVGVGNDYFTPQDVEDFNSAVRRFIENNPLAPQALSIYPDLLLTNSSH